MSSYTAIPLGDLPPPDVIEALDYETILQAMTDDLVARDPAYSALLESDPAMKVLEVAALRELLLRQRVNEAARSVMLAHAGGADLDNIGALYGVARLLVDAGDPDAIPPVAPTYESDSRFRTRLQLAMEGLSVAGPGGAYLYHALSASGDVLDVAVQSPTPGAVVVTVLSAVGDGTPDQALLDAVTAVLTDEDVRPLTDQVTVQAATIIDYSVDAALELYDGPDAAVVAAAAEDALAVYVAARHRLGDPVTLTGLHAAAHVAGVKRVVLASPAADIDPAGDEATWCTAIAVATA